MMKQFVGTRKCTGVFAIIIFALIYRCSGIAAAGGNFVVDVDPSIEYASGQQRVDRYYAENEADLRFESWPLTAKQQAIHAEFDRLCGQKDCYSSRLFWHRDFAEATAEAERRAKPILALYLLGNLTDELSCANSRFFRAILYSNPDIAAFLRENYVLYWKSVRPVPSVTIDFGNGRVLRETITGNSIHYLLSSSGRPVDALPGLYKPQAFLAALREFSSNAPWQSSAATPTAIVAYQRSRVSPLFVWTAPRAIAAAPLAADALPIASSKAMMETRVLKTIRAPEAARAEKEIMQTLRRIGSTESPEQMFHPASLTFIERHSPRLAASALQNFAKSVAADTEKNDTTLRPTIRRWLIWGGGGIKLDALNRRVYAELFLTPDSDPWIGLDPTRVYSGLYQNGVDGLHSNNERNEQRDPSLMPSDGK